MQTALLLVARRDSRRVASERQALHEERLVPASVHLGCPTHGGREHDRRGGRPLPSLPPPQLEQGWLNPGVRGIGAASLLSDAGHEVPTSLLPAFLTSTLGAPASALGLIEGISDGLAGAARLGGGALADDPLRRRATAVGGYASTAVLSG